MQSNDHAAVSLRVVHNVVMTLTVRLDEETRKLLERLVRTQRLSRSEVVRRGIHILAEHEGGAVETDPYKTIQHLIGVRGGQRDLSVRTDERFRRALTEKRNRSRRSSSMPARSSPSFTAS